MKRLALCLALLVLFAGVAWLVLRLFSTLSRDPVERLVKDMVRIPGRDYYMGKYEVTQAQWEAVMGEKPLHDKGPNYPAESIPLDACLTFLEKLNEHPVVQASGLIFRLPMEDEWEFACRAGSTNDYCRLANGMVITKATVDRVAWYKENSMTSRPEWVQGLLDFVERVVDSVYDIDLSAPPVFWHAHPVGRKKPNAWGLYDMHGNVMEWTDSMHGYERVVRGGCFMDPASSCAASHRERRGFGIYLLLGLGFRLCATERVDPALARVPTEADCIVAIERHLREVVGPRAKYEGGWKYCVPLVKIVAFDPRNPSDIKVYGEFRIFHYRLDGNTFHFVSGGNHPGLMHLRESYGVLKVYDFMPVFGGDIFLPSAQRIFGRHFQKWKALVDDEETLEAARLQSLADFAARNHLPARYCQNPGCEPVPLPHTGP